MEQTLGTLAVPTRYSSTDHVPTFFLSSLRIALVDSPTGSFFYLNFFLIFSCSLERRRDEIPAQFPQLFSRFLFRNKSFFIIFFSKKKGYLQQLDPGYLTLPYLTSYKTKKIWTVSYLISVCLSVCLARGEASERSILSFRGNLFFFSL